MKIKTPLGQISIETNYANGKRSYFEFFSCAWSISSKYAEKKD